MGRTIASDPLQKFRFKVEVDSIEFGCKTVGGLEKELEVTTYREGGYKATHKLPGIMATGTLSLDRGSFPNLDTYNLFKSSLEDESFRKSITISEKNRLDVTVRQWVLDECWASKFTAPEFDAESSDVSVEQIEIQYEDITPSII